jgi:hypothetical protein
MGRRNSSGSGSGTGSGTGSGSGGGSTHSNSGPQRGRRVSSGGTGLGSRLAIGYVLTVTDGGPYAPYSNCSILVWRPAC